MLDYVLNLEFAVLTSLAILVAVGIVLAGRTFMKEQRKVRPEFLTNPANIAITVITFLTPLLIAGIAYSESKGLTNGLPTLMSCFILLFISMATAIWFHFALLKKGTEQDYIVLNYPKKDTRYVSALGLIYVLVFFTFVYLAKYITIDFKSEREQKTELEDEVSVLVSRPAIVPGMDKEKVHELWGRPDSSDSTGINEQYRTHEFKIHLEYNKESKLVLIKIEKP